jgi:4-phytase/acid phosphatase
LSLHWIADARSDDTPPGGALVFELWRAASGEDSVRVYYTAQTLEQMRSATVLSIENPPARVPVFIPACGRVDFSCSLGDFETALQRLLAAQRP